MGRSHHQTVFLNGAFRHGPVDRLPRQLIVHEVFERRSTNLLR